MGQDGPHMIRALGLGEGYVFLCTLHCGIFLH